MASWDFTTDFAVVGSGGGLVGALAAREAGLEALVVEKRDLIGGSTAMSGGIIWLPDNPLLAAEGVADSYEDGMAYFEDVVGDVGPASSFERRDAYLREGPAMVRFLQRLGVEFIRCEGYSDYYSEAAGAKVRGRSIETRPFDAHALGPWQAKLQPGFLSDRGVAIHTVELQRFGLPWRSVAGVRTVARVLTRTAAAKLRGQQLLANGAALVANLLKLVLEREIPVWTETPLLDLVVDDGVVTGIVVERHGRQVRVRTRRGVLLAAGGFAHNAEMRRKFSGDQPNEAAWTSANPGDTGEVIDLAMQHGAAVDLMDEAWWVQTSVLPNGTKLMHIAERTRPGSIMVDASGRRFVNEAASYMEVGQEQYARRHVAEALPCWLVFDTGFRRRYPFVMTPPAVTPKEWIAAGYLHKADTLEDLARDCGIDPEGLRTTVERFNEGARRGEDPDFHRGEARYDHYYGDPAHKPNPSLGPLEKPPYYAVAIYPGDVGTCGGLLTDEHGRVLREDGSPFPGLYATGNTTATVMGRRYLGAGASIGSSMVFAYIAGSDAATRARAGATPT
jgi:succinate dehydrogenase/fumarate reductase flavoprotein subunit